MPFLVLPFLALLGLLPQAGSAQDAADDRARQTAQREFFEARIRPVLVEHCYACHNSKDTTEAGLALDHRAGVLKGGDSGAVMVPGKPAESRLLATMRHELEGLEMPQGGAKLDDRALADFEKWIADGAYDPRDEPPSDDELAAATSWDAQLQRRKQWWCFQPIRAVEPPQVAVADADADPDADANADWAGHEIDRFVFARLHDAELPPVELAEPAVLVRRLYVNLVGMVPRPEDAAVWTKRLRESSAEERQQVVTELVDQLLDSPRFGERWARHWMDWIRYAESHGSEGDPAIANAWVYRDYLIRALNEDLPLDQLIREHIAGDLLPEPRVNPELGINESIIGTAHWRMVFHGFAPTDALEEKVRFVDDQINAVSKAFLGLTVSCARCHDHKFDAISQRDYYAMFGILGSCRPGRTAIDLPEQWDERRAELALLKPKLQAAVAADWLAALERLDEQSLLDQAAALPEADKEIRAVLSPLAAVQRAMTNGQAFSAAWNAQVTAFLRKRHEAQAPRESVHHWQLGRESDDAQWYRHGAALRDMPMSSGEFAVVADGDQVIEGIYPAGVYSHGISAKLPARLTSRDFGLKDGQEIWLRVLGDGNAMARYVVQDYPRDGTVYPVASLSNQWRWQRFDVAYWSGDQIHLELTTANDAPLLVRNQPRSWFGVREVVVRSKDQPAPADWPEHLVPIYEAAAAAEPQSARELAKILRDAIARAIRAWSAGTIGDSQALLLDECLRQGLLPNQRESLTTASPLVDQYREIEAQIPVPTRVPSLDESTGRDQQLFVRGDHRQAGEPVPRRFLEAIDSAPYRTEQSGRLQLAEDLLRSDNPLTRRVLVNRVWHHLFGQGIVSTPDNFGRLGDTPTHPELLDWLAIRFDQQGWSLKELIRTIVMTRVWQLDSRPSPRALAIDPENRLLSHAHVRRMEAEAIRDTLLQVSGLLDTQLGGPPVNGDQPRRSVYVQVRRNSLDPFLRAFDFPEPFSCEGRRAVTNVPAQSLTMLNDPRIAEYARSWAERILQGEPGLAVGSSENADTVRLRKMFLTALGREATEDEVKRSFAFLQDARRHLESHQRQVTIARQTLADCQTQIAAIKEPVRQRLLSEREQEGKQSKGFAPEPTASWEFDESPHDTVGNLELVLRDGAVLDDGALLLRQGAYAVTQPLPFALKAKTIEAWVQLDDLQQTGGGVISVQTPDGTYFDAMVFAEQSPQQWLAGSNFFARTQPFGGPPETEADHQPVHIAIVYHDDGTIVAYRNGLPYGKPYKSDGPYPFAANQTVVSFGVRHLPAGGNRMLAGGIYRAQLYDRALSAEEVAASSGAAPGFVPHQRIIDALSEQDRATVERLTAEIAMLETQLAELGDVPQRVTDAMVWTELARAIFTFKEFTYVR